MHSKQMNFLAYLYVIYYLCLHFSMLESTSHYTNSNWLLGDKRVKGDTAAVELIIKIDPNHNHNQRCFYIFPGNGDVASNEIKRRLIALSATRNLFDVAGGSDHQDDQEEHNDDDDDVGAYAAGWQNNFAIEIRVSESP